MSRAVLPVILSFVAPGAGHVYLTTYRRAVIAFAIWLVALAGSVWAELVLPGWVAVAGAGVILLGALTGIAADAFLVARNRGDRRLANSRWALVLLLGLANWWLIPLVGSNFHRHFSVSSESMERTLLKGDRIVARTGFLRSEIGAFDIVVFRWPDDDTELFIGRVAGTPGDTVAMSDWTLSVNGTEIEEPYVQVSDSAPEPHPWMDWQREHLVAARESDSYRPSNRDWGPLVVPDDGYFILGDHRNLSFDSRYRGFASRKSVTGKVERVFLSMEPDEDGVRWDRFGLRVRP